MTTRTDFAQNGPLSSFYGLRVFFTNPKMQLFQKVAFYTNQTGFGHLLFSKHAFWAGKVETDGH